MTIVVGTYGDPAWADLAARRALPSAYAQGCPVIHVHGDTLAQARNTGIARARTTWISVLDADDELAPGYTAGLLAGHADIRAPRLVQVYRDGRRREIMGLPARNIETINPIPVCALARRDQVLAAGGFGEWPHWEDYALWLTMVRRGHNYEHLPTATYYWHVRPGSRNRTVRRPAQLLAQIHAACR